MTLRPLFGDFALPEAARICRLLLPLRIADGAVLSWAAVGRTRGRMGDWLDGYVDLHELIEWPGDGSYTSEPQVDHPAGLLDRTTADRLVRVLAAYEPAEPWLTPGRSGGVPLTELTESWYRRRFEGPATSGDGRMRIDAPAYADSLVLSGPDDLCPKLLGEGLEVFPVARSAYAPITTD